MREKRERRRSRASKLKLSERREASEQGCNDGRPRLSTNVEKVRASQDERIGDAQVIIARRARMHACRSPQGERDMEQA